MRIAIDARALGWAGIGRYTSNLLFHLAKLPTKHEFIILVGKTKPDVRLPANFSLQPVEPSYYSWREQTVFWRQLENISADVFHFAHFNVPVLFRRPYIVTIHDTTRFIFPGQQRQHIAQQIAYEYTFAQAVRHARRIICVSQSTRRELLSLPLFGRPPAKPLVVYEGVEQQFFDPVRQADRQRIRLMLGSADPYLLYVGVWMSHKNLRRLFAAYQLLAEEMPNLQLVVTGRPRPGYINIAKIVRELPIADRVLFPGFVPHNLLPALYAEASCTLYPSLYEGFGMPPLESAACGTPVVASHVSSIPEIMGQAAEYCNPEYILGIAAAVKHVLTDQTRRGQLRQAGWKRARHFSWEEAARQHLEVYQAAV